MAKHSIFLDTNIIADMIDAKRVNHEVSIVLLEKLMTEDHTIVMSEDMLSTLYYISKDKKATLEFFENIVFIDWQVVHYGREVMRKATDLSLREEVDLEDTLQCLCAKNNGCQVLITNDKKFVSCGIDIVSSEEFLKEII